MSYLYSDLNLLFAAHPNTKDVVRRFDLDAVKGAVRNLIKTNHGEKLFDSNFGANLDGLLFEPITGSMKMLLLRRLEELLIRYEPRAEILDLQVFTSPEPNTISIMLNIALKSNPDITFTVPIKL